MIQLPSSKGRQVPRGTQPPLFHMAPGKPAPPSPPKEAPSKPPARDPNVIAKGETIPMFMQAKDLQALPPWPGDKQTADEYEREYDETDDELWDRKLDESFDSGLYHSIAMEGVKRPVHVLMRDNGARVHGQGHHRTAASAYLNPDQFVPVLHTNDQWEALAGTELDGSDSRDDSWG